jgi:hypothetical protein
MDSVAVDVDEIADIVWPPGDSKMARAQSSSRLIHFTSAIAVRSHSCPDATTAGRLL